jgi:hypothetical protein
VEIEGGDLGATRFVAFHAVAPRGGDVPQWSSDLGKLTRYCTGGTPRSSRVTSTRHSTIRCCATAGCSNAAAQCGKGLQATWPTWMPDWFGPQIDHVFVTNPIAAEDFSVREVSGSDHRAVLVRLRLPD